MRIAKKIVSALLVIAIMFGMLPLKAEAATPTVYSINNGYMEYSINTETGGFSIATLKGHPQKKYDNNKRLLYDGTGTETSFTTVRIDGEDYIFGQDYGFFGIDSKLDQPVVNNVEKSISTKWSIKTKKGTVNITQKVMLSSDPNNDLCGNAGVGYTIQNLGEPVEIAIRTLLDSAIGELDAPYLVKDTDLIPTIFEKEYSIKDGNLPTQIRGLDNTLNPTAISYVLLKGWNNLQTSVPTRAIVGHWANLANTRFDYTPDKNCEFVNYSNAYRTPDSAVALYWDGQTIGKNSVRNAEFLYGIGNFSSQLSDAPVNINMTVGTVSLTDDKKGYVNGGMVTVTAEIDNTIDDAKDIETPIVQISLENGLKLVDPNTEAQTLADLKKGQSRTVTWELVADPQTVVSAKEIAVTLVTKTTSYSANRFLIVPSATGNLPKVTFTKATPDKFYYLGDKNFNLSGSLNELVNPLKGKTGWDIVLIHDGTGDRTVINKDTVAFVGNTNKSISFSTDKELALGDYSIIFEFTDPNLQQGFGYRITVPQKIEVNADKSLMSKRYGILVVERYDTSKYKISTFLTEEALNEYIEENGLSTKPSEITDASKEILLQVRGTVREFTENGKTYYSADPSNEDVTVNGVVQYAGTEPLVMEQTGDNVLVKGKGNLSVINYLTFWKSNFQIQFKAGTVSTLDADVCELKNIPGNPDKNIVKIEYTGVGSVIQKIAAFTINLKYGELISLWDDDNNFDGYAIDFGGKMALSFMPTQDKKADVAKKDEEEEDGDPVVLGADIENILYGQTSEGVKFKGIRGTFEFGLPENAMGGMIKNPPIEASLSIDTIDKIYEVNLGINVKVIECSGTLRIKVVEIKGKEIPLPDKFYLSIASEVGVPLVPPFVDLKGLSGGYDNLADTVTGNYVGSLPPITLLLGAKLGLIQVLEGEFDLELGLTHMKLDGKLSIANLPGIEITGGLEARWIDPFYIYAYGQIDVFGAIKGGVSITIADNYFYGYGYVILQIPDSIPIIGGFKLAEIEAAISNQLIGANVRVLGIGMGVVYYWSDGSVDFGGQIDLKPKAMSLKTMSLMAVEQNTTPSGEEYLAMYGTNMHRLQTQSVTTKKMRSMALKSMSAVSNIEKVITAAGQEALILEIPYTGGFDPNISNTTFAVGGVNMPLVLDSSLTGGSTGNFLLQEREGKKYLYISVIDKSFIEDATYSISCTDTSITFSDIIASGVDNLPELSSISATKQGSSDIKIDWDIAYDGSKTEGSEVAIYLTKDKNAINAVKNTSATTSNADLGINVGKFPAKDKSATVTIPDTCPDGDYYVIITMSVPDAGISIKSTDTPINFVNTMLPVPVQSVAVSNIGDCSLAVSMTEPQNADYTHYMVEVKTADGDEVTNGQFMFKKEENIKIGPQITQTLIEGGKSYIVYVQTVREDSNKKSYFGTQKVASQPFTVAIPNSPKLLSINKNINGNGEKLSKTELNAQYNFNQPVKLAVYVNQTLVSVNTEYKAVWDFNYPLIDGDYLVTISAANAQGDKYVSQINGVNAIAKTTKSSSSNILENDSALSFTIDNTPPVLKITSEETKNAAGDKKISVGSQAIRANNGTVVIKGISEKGVKLLLDGSSDGVVIDEAGNFTITRKVDFENGMQKALSLTAEDETGNKNETTVFAINADIDSFDGLVIKKMINNAPTAIENDSVTMKTGESLNFKLFANYKLINGEHVEIPLTSQAATWSLMGGSYVGTFNEGLLIAKAPGTIYLRASYVSGIYESSEDTSNQAIQSIESIVEVKIQGEPIEKPIDGDDTQNNTQKNSQDNDTLQALLTEFLKSVGNDKLVKAIRLSKTLPISGYLTDSITYFAPPGSVDDTDMLVVYKAKDGDKLKQSISKGKVLGDIVGFELMKNKALKIPVTLEYHLKSGEDGNKIGLYRYNKWFDAWEYIDGTYNKGDNTVSAQINPKEGLYCFLQKDVAEKKMLDTVNHWAKSAINRLASLDIISGVKTTKGLMYYPNQSITRAELIAIAVRAMKINVDDYADVALPFNDIQQIPNWALPYIKAAYKEGWISGVATEKGISLEAKTNIKRQDALTILYNIKEMKNTSNNISFTDAKEISGYARNAVNAFVEYDIVNGYPNGAFGPKSNISRGEAATVIASWIESILSK